MRAGLYFRLAGGNIRKNGKVYFPYILTCVCMISIFYITAFLARDPGVRAMRGGNSLSVTLSFGCAVVGIFSAIFLFYTNSFIVKRRRRELGLYNILGMAKHNIAEVMFVENAIIGAAGLVFGLVFGVLLSKLAQMCLFRLMGHVAGFDFYVSVPLLLTTSAVYAVIFTVIYLGSLKRLGTASPIELLHESSVGERAPKGNLPAALVGLVILGSGYWLALSIKDPLQVTLLFFVAVILVIIGTYICFISGSVMFLQLLRKNRRYYYSKKHFVPVSGMSYRMKRNGAGLASICILSTMVVVTLSSVMSLYIGLKDTLRTRYCRDYIVTVRNCGEASADAVSEYIGSLISGSGLKAKNLVKLRYFTGYGKISGGNVDFGADGLLSHIYAVSAADAGVSLQEGCALVSAEDGTLFETLSFEGWRSYTVTGEAPDLPIPESSGSGAVRIVLPDSSDVYGMADFYSVSRHGAEEGRTLPDLCIGFDAVGSSDEKSGLSDRIGNGIGKALESGDGYESYRCTGIEPELDDFLAAYSGLLFIGILLGAAFVVAAVLIMYYKQVSEGYEDQSRFGIMQKVGMTVGEIRTSVNSQILTVFFLPLAVSAVHMGFAFPMVNRVLQLFGLVNVRLFLAVTAGVFLVFALFYVIVYAVTSKAYISIISIKPARRAA